jgi:hypothetical protein
MDVLHVEKVCAGEAESGKWLLISLSNGIDMLSIPTKTPNTQSI